MGVGNSGGCRDGYILRLTWSRKLVEVCKEHLEWKRQRVGEDGHLGFSLPHGG